jgi:predicted Rossmann fold flavoprotein
VRVSGGGRCNVTHACFDPKILVKNYPRGEAELLGPFMRFNPKNTIEWFAKKGVEIKKEADGRMFPITDSSETIIECFITEAKRLKVEVNLLEGIENITQQDDLSWHVSTNRNKTIAADAVIVTTGSAAKMWQLLENVGHSIAPPVPSLFTFNIKDARIEGLAGVALRNASARIKQLKLQAEGALLITHWGLSGPAILRLSAWGARVLHQCNHHFDVQIDFTGIGVHETTLHIEKYKQHNPQKQIGANPLFDIPQRLWKNVFPEKIATKKWNETSKKDVNDIIELLCRANFKVTGKSTNKEEFVTAGGLTLKEVDFKTMESKKAPNLYFAGEVLNIDAITGGFNFQAAWTTAWIAAQNIGK